MKGMDCYGFEWITMGLYGFLNFCMDISLFHFYCLVRNYPNPRFVKSWLDKTLVCIR